MFVNKVRVVLFSFLFLLLFYVSRLLNYVWMAVVWEAHGLTNKVT